MGKSILPLWVWIVLWVTLFVYLGALALEKKTITSVIEKAGKVIATVFILLVVLGFFFAKRTSESEGFLNF